jgi:hypothetical protein
MGKFISHINTVHINFDSKSTLSLTHLYQSKYKDSFKDDILKGFVSEGVGKIITFVFSKTH